MIHHTIKILLMLFLIYEGFFCLLVFAVLGLELRAYTLSYSTSPFLQWFFSK
jgi:hypothetical protein